MTYPACVRIVEVGPRDGLQNEAVAVAVPTRIALIAALQDAGLADIEVGSFVSARAVPQMADTDAVLRGMHRPGGTRYWVLVPNMQGYAQARAADVRHVAVFASASERFSQANINCSIAQSLDRFAPVIAAAHADGVRVRGYISCVLGCPFEGVIAPGAVADVAQRLTKLGCDEISLGDTIGVGTPVRTQALVRAVAEVVPIAALALHCHDTYGQALANILAGLECGIAIVDSSVGGLGGCPYAPGGTGNVASEDLVYMLDGMSIRTGVDLTRLRAAGALIGAALQRPTASRVARALDARGQP